MSEVLAAGGVRLVRTRAEVRAWVAEARLRGETVGLVPTMGYLHAGHLSLVERARRQADRVAMSIFVNPLQFGPSEDLDRYPRDLYRDLELAAGAGVDLVFAPEVREMYPEAEPWVVVTPRRGADLLCGASRPGHFTGVLTVVAKLFGVFAPDVAVFGRKDLQQLVLIRRMVHDLDMPVRVEAGEIVRDPDGLAMSSRNAYLSPDERRRALVLHRVLRESQEAFARGERSVQRLRDILWRADGDGVAVEYAEVVDPWTLAVADVAEPGSVCAIAARVGATRLIDNLALEAPAP